MTLSIGDGILLIYVRLLSYASKEQTLGAQEYIFPVLSLVF
jgi:hypothetical protein